MLGSSVSKINSRAKGATAERELIGLLRDWLGDEIAGKMKRNLEQSRKGGHDLDGLDGWAIEVKRYKSLSDAALCRIWDGQVLDQARKVQSRPVLAYKGDFKPWRVRLPICLLRDVGSDWDDQWACGFSWTADIGIEAFASVVREAHSASVLLKEVAPPTIQA